MWYHQAFAHDLYDRDEVHAMLVTVRRGADKLGQVAVSTGKGGYVLGLDPRNGKLLWRTAVGLHRDGDLPSLRGSDNRSPRYLRGRPDTAGLS